MERVFGAFSMQAAPPSKKGMEPTPPPKPTTQLVERTEETLGSRTRRVVVFSLCASSGLGLAALLVVSLSGYESSLV